MSHILPPLGHPARDLFDVSALVDVATGVLPIQCHRPALRKQAEQTFATVPAAKRLAYFYMDPSNDQLQLVTIGKRGGFKVEWVFGPIGRGARLA